MSDAGGKSQTVAAVLMIRPAHFGSNAETAASNFFQGAAGEARVVAPQAQREFDALACALANAGVRVHTFEGQQATELPDEVFPNNWLSLHADGTAVLYPLLAANRRRERRPEILNDLRDRYRYRLERIVDLTQLEARGDYLEGTGSLVLDHRERVAYACLSPRTHSGALDEFARALHYEVVPFAAVDRQGRPIYHTNVLLSVGTRFAALCTSAIVDPAQRRAVRARLEGGERELIDLTFAELTAFAGNLLELRGARGPVIALSAAAARALRPSTRARLEHYGELVTADVTTIERVGGGSVRCMLAEIALPRED